jgi:Ethanolamine utilization protein EutJ (predicted chaperonin)
MIRTDGISICIIFIIVDKNGKPLPKTIQNNNNKEDETIKYIEKATITEELKSKKIVVADPNFSDWLYCGSKNKDGELKTFRYTQNQRRLETKLKKYNNIIDKVNKITEKTIKEHETILSKLNSKTCNYDKFKEYIIEKNKLNIILFDHYQQTFFRKLKLNRFINTQKSESKLVKNFSKKFGSPNM